MSVCKIAGQLNCHLSNVLEIYIQFVSSCSTENKAGTGRSIQISERGGKTTETTERMLYYLKSIVLS